MRLRFLLHSATTGSLLATSALASTQSEPGAEPATAPAPSMVRGATPKNIRQWAPLVAQNYPVEAVRSELEGRVGVQVEIDPTGAVSRCMVTSSSGHAILDEAACKGMERYAQFNPARDSEGRPARGRYKTTVTFALHKPATPPAEKPAPASRTI